MAQMNRLEKVALEWGPEVQWLDSDRTMSFYPNNTDYVMNAINGGVSKHVGGEHVALNLQPLPVIQAGGQSCVEVRDKNTNRMVLVPLLTMYATTFIKKPQGMYYPRTVDGNHNNLNLFNVTWSEYTFNDNVQLLKMFEVSRTHDGNYNIFIKDGTYLECTAWHISQIFGGDIGEITNTMYRLADINVMEECHWLGLVGVTKPKDRNELIAVDVVPIFDFNLVVAYIDECIDVDDAKFNEFLDGCAQGYNLPFILIGSKT